MDIEMMKDCPLPGSITLKITPEISRDVVPPSPEFGHLMLIILIVSGHLILPIQIN
jgi:hypothetical protein